jgi:hypothetical protein
MLAEYKTPKAVANRRQFTPDPTSSTPGTASTQTTKENTDQSPTNDRMTFTQTTNAKAAETYYKTSGAIDHHNRYIGQIPIVLRESL